MGLGRELVIGKGEKVMLDITSRNSRTGGHIIINVNLQRNRLVPYSGKFSLVPNFCYIIQRMHRR